MAFRKAAKGVALVGGGALATFYGLSRLSEYRRNQARLVHVEAAEQVQMTFEDELPSRQVQLAALRSTEEFDVLIIGGGATGSGCALDAVTRSKYKS
ncbi:glycerol-3-phosphate dehydrogenase, mitochondrial isoform X1 [Arapaima gigas]